jgi:hypothetical protein
VHPALAVDAASGSQVKSIAQPGGYAPGCLELGMADCLGREALLIYSDKGKEDNAPWAKFASIEKRRCHACPLKRPEALRRELARFLD